MTIRPPSDIVLEVAQSAEPARLSAALRKLDAPPDAAAAFADALGTAGASRPAPGQDNTVATRLAALDRPAGAGAINARDPYQKLEAFLLQSFLQTMMPSPQAVFGRGATASIHRSMLAEQLADQLMRTGGLGIAANLAAAHQGREEA